MIPTISVQLSERVDRAERTMLIVWVALMGSVALYGVALHQISRNSGAMSPDPITLPPLLPLAIALSLAATGTVLFRAMSAPERMRALLELARTPHEEPQDLSEAERRLSRVPPMLFTLYVMRWAIFESIAVVGLVLGILQGSLEAYVPYGVAAIALIAIARPRIRSRVIEAIPLLPANVRAGS